MAKIYVDLNASYGCNCMGCSYDSEETIEIEVSNNVLNILREIDASEIASEKVLEAIKEGKSELETIHKQITDSFYYMVEDYWLYEADNECIEESLSNTLDNDIESGIYTPISIKDFFEKVKSDEISLSDLKFDIEDEDLIEELIDNEEDYDWEDDEDAEYVYNRYLLNDYYDWVYGNDHDHEFIAERVGLDIEACRDVEVNYTINLNK